EAGFTWLKMDLGLNLVSQTPGTVTRPEGIQGQYGGLPMEHMFMATEVTDKGLDMMGEYVAAVREVVGLEIPPSADHFGPLSVNSCIRLGKELTKYNLSWLEDMIPWQETDLLKKISDAVDIPILTGEDIYLKEPFEALCRAHAVDIIHPDPLTDGGILETKKIGDIVRSPHGDSLRPYAHRRARLRPRGGRDRELPGDGESRRRGAVLERPGRRHREAHREQGLHHRSR
ncbi:MAG TPA: enolase C-terminal domain-like protein, partial [Mycobacterium sp.]|nr:enolase C-terminal domain-like protein [Mycobacterium sp.]